MQFNILLLFYKDVFQRLKNAVIKFSELMYLIPPLCCCLFSLPLKHNYIISSLVVGARDFFLLVLLYNSSKQPYNIFPYKAIYS